jgi:hypothetical protein
MTQQLLRPEQSSMKLKKSGQRAPAHSFWSVAVRKLNGEAYLVADFEHNVFPAGCIDVIHQNTFTSTSISGSGFNYIGLTADTTQTINSAQTTLTGEITANGLARQRATTRTHTVGTNSTLLEYTFTLTGTQSDITRAALFNDAGPPGGGSAGVMGPFAAFSSATGQMNSGETIKASITINTT